MLLSNKFCDFKMFVYHMFSFSFLSEVMSYCEIIYNSLLN